MAIPDRVALLGELDGLEYRERMRRAASLGREGAGTPALESLLAELQTGDSYEQRLALAICRTSGDVGRVLRALDSAVVPVRRRAARLAAHLVGDDALAGATLAAPAIASASVEPNPAGGCPGEFAVTPGPSVPAIALPWQGCWPIRSSPSPCFYRPCRPRNGKLSSTRHSLAVTSGSWSCQTRCWKRCRGSGETAKSGGCSA